MYTITIDNIYQLLMKHNLLITPKKDNNDIDQVPFDGLSYNSKELPGNCLFFCKGINFKKEWLIDVLDAGVTTYLTEVSYGFSENEILVRDIREAMALIAQAFYQNPQDKLIKIGITGTKGKTSAAYFIHALLKDAFGPKIALFSSEETTTDGQTYQASVLTTPEALVLYKQMAQAVDAGVSHLVMEVSSQAYKTKRVFGITFEVGVFLNISPDHISPIEHPTFEDYFACKQQLLLNSQQVVLNNQSDRFDELAALCQEHEIPAVTYGSQTADYPVIHGPELREFRLAAKEDFLQLNGDYHLAMFGDFNHGNAAAALIATALVDTSKDALKHSLLQTTIPGRMNFFELKNGAYAFVDFAHNYLSLSALGTFAQDLRPEGRVILVTGSAGGKALSRRKDMGQVISETYDVVVLTEDDPDFEDPASIADEIQSHITNPEVEVLRELDRSKAISLALSLATPSDIVIVAGKGTEAGMKVKGQSIDYLGDVYYTQHWIDNQKT